MKPYLFLLFALITGSVLRGEDSDQDKAKRLFDSLNKDGDTVLSIDELTEYELSKNPQWKDADFQALPGFRDLAQKKARTKAIDDFTFYSKDPSKPEVTVAAFLKFLTTEDPKFDAPPPTSVEPEKPPGRFATASKFELKQSSTVVDQEKLPARFSWTAARGKKAVFSIDAAMSYTFDLTPKTGDFPFQSLEFSPTIEAHTSNDPTASQDSISAKPTFSILSKNTGSPLVSSHYFSISPDYEQDYKGKTETIGIDLSYSPNSEIFSIGRVRSLSDDKIGYPAYLWRPYFGVEYGHAIKSDGTTEFKEGHEYLRLVGQIHFELFLKKGAEIAVDYYHRRFLSGNEKSFDYVEVSPIFYLGTLKDGATGAKSPFSIGLTYKNGKNTPNFTSVDSFGAWIGVQY